jgi:lipopolysaccharide transport system ATP-binding protein
MPMLALENLGKAYRRYRHPRDRLLEMIAPWAEPRHETIWVLRNIDLSIDEGESVGIIGHNGAGKSTLLKLVTGTAMPTEGSVRTGGRIAAILELGMGFHPEFTGRQNALISGQLLGLSPEEVAGSIPDIEAFAEIGAYFDQPLRVYSSGMQVRLAFSVATAVRPDVLIVDEALSVGDLYFQHKCTARMRSFRDQGTTMLLVSHDPTAVKTLCDRAVLLDRGAVVKEGLPDLVLDYYNAIIAKREADYRIREVEGREGTRRSIRSGDARATIESVDLQDAQGLSTRTLHSNAPASICVTFETRAKLTSMTVGFLIRDRLGNDVFGTNTHHLATPIPSMAAGQRFACEFMIERVSLGCGHYSIAIALHESDSHLVNNHDWWEHALVFEVLRADEPLRIGVANLAVRSGGIVAANAQPEHG